MLASGSFQQVVGDVDKSSVSRVVTHFCESLVNKKHLFIKFPRTVIEKDAMKKKFFKVGGFPSTIACVDGLHVPIVAPSNDENSFVNRKGWHSINVEGVNDADNVFVDIVAKWPGSTHDSFIFRTSNLHRIDDGLILGDSGYALCRYLMTPYADPVTRPEKRYTRAHKSTRCSVERSIGQLKRRFASLNRGLRLNPNKCCLVIVASVILHNIAKHLQEEDFENEDENYFCAEMEEGFDLRCNEAGRLVRQHVTTTFFHSINIYKRKRNFSKETSVHFCVT